MKVLILGAKGQLGRALLDLCQIVHIPFVALGKEEADITNEEQIHHAINGKGFTHIFNCAAYTNVDQAEKEPQLAYAINAIGPEVLAKVAGDEGIRLVHVSTDYVFDGEKGDSYTEEDLPNPLGVYGKSKWEGEQRVLAVLPNVCIVRTSWVFGSYGNNFISQLMKKLYSDTVIYAVEDQYNRATFVRDLAFALIDLCCHSGIFHFANQRPQSRFQITKDFYELAKKHELPIRCQGIEPVPMAHFPSPTPRPKHSVLDTTKITKTLGRKPRLWETVLYEYFDSVKAGA